MLKPKDPSQQLRIAGHMLGHFARTITTWALKQACACLQHSRVASTVCLTCLPAALVQFLLQMLRTGETSVDMFYNLGNWKQFLLSPPCTNFRNILDFVLATAQYQVRAPPWYTIVSATP
jgi:hypothetical protein